MVAYIESPIGVIRVEEQDHFIISASIVDIAGKSDWSPLLADATLQLQEYFEGNRKTFDLPIKQEGTYFQQKVWNYLSSIPYGQTVSYKKEATDIGSPKAFRAAGSANAKNRICIIVPCHRVINENGSLGGYAYGLKVKEYLLALERSKNK